jgi:hypothetical protein
MKKIIHTLREKWAEYLLEIGVIIISILGAFSLNAWYAAHKDADTELEFLKDIQAGFSILLDNCQDNLEREREIMEDMDKIHSYIYSSKAYDDTLAQALSRSLFSYTRIWADFGAYESLKAVGLKTITNDSLRNFISIQFGQRLPGRLKEQGRVNAFIDSFDEVRPLWFTGEAGNIPWDFEVLKKDRKFIHLVNFSRERAGSSMAYYQRVIPGLESIIRWFELEIQLLSA